MLTDRHEGPIQTYMTKIIVALRNCTNAPRKCYKKRETAAVNFGPQHLSVVPLQLNVDLLGALSKNFILHIGNRAYLKSTSDEIQLLLYNGLERPA
jgi:hypothetical protein